VKDVDDELTAGEQAVYGEFSGTDCDGGRVVLRKESLCVSVHVRIAIRFEKQCHHHHPSIHPDALGNHPALPNAVFTHVLMETPAPTPPTNNGMILTAMVSSCDVRFVDFEGLQGRDVPFVGCGTDVEIDFWNQSPIGGSRIQGPEDPSSTTKLCAAFCGIIAARVTAVSPAALSH